MIREDRRMRRRVRRSQLISTVSIAMVLFLMGTTAYLVANVMGATSRLRESVVIHVMLRGGLSDEQVSTLRTGLESHETVREVTFVPRAEAAERFIDETGEDFRSFLGDDPAANPLPDSFEVGLAAEGTEREAIEALVAAIEATDGVDEVVYQRGVVEQVGTNLAKFNLVAALFAAALTVISVILLHNTIRMSVTARQRTINTMKMVGATTGFIMRPFVWSAVLRGLWAGLAATALFALLVVGLREGIPELGFSRGNVLVGSIVGGMVATGVVVSVVFTVAGVAAVVRRESGITQM